MIYVFNKDSNLNLKLFAGTPEAGLCKETLWVDLFEPTIEEDRLVEQFLKISIPTKEEMAEIELSNRLYEEDDAFYMTVNLPIKVDTNEPESQSVTFILTKETLVTLRYSEPKSFKIFCSKLEKQKLVFSNPENVLLGLLESITGRVADILENLVLNTELLSKKLFKNYSKLESEKVDYQKVLEDIGVSENLTSKLGESLVSIERMAKFLRKNKNFGTESITDLKSITADIDALSGFTRNIENKLTFMLDATLGMISIEQNRIIKIMSVAAMVFFPPTLIASIYGMNFEMMPELSLTYGYPIAICLMLLSGLYPYVYFRRKKWL
jgi:magnesium transporter